jgi:hypothetical protein
MGIVSVPRRGSSHGQGSDGLARGRRAASCCSRGGDRNEQGALANRKQRQNRDFGTLPTRHLLAAGTAIEHTGKPLAKRWPFSWGSANRCALRRRLTQGRNRRRRHEPSLVAVGTARPLGAADALQEVLHRRRDHRIGFRYRQGLPCQRQLRRLRRRSQQAVVPNPLETARQDVQQEAVDELLRRQLSTRLPGVARTRKRTVVSSMPTRRSFEIATRCV